MKEPSTRSQSSSAERILVPIILLGSVLVFFGSALDSDRVFVSTGMIYGAPPFSASSDGQRVHNPFLSDHATILYPWAFHARNEIRSGEFPLWSPDVYGGAPFFGNLSTGLLFPLTWLYILLPFHLSLVVVAILKLWLAAVFMWAFLKRLSLGSAPALCGGIAFAFCGYNVLWLNFALSHASCMAPLILWAIEVWRSKPKPLNTFFVSALLAASFFAGHPETTVGVWSVAGAYWAIRAMSIRREHPRATYMPVLGFLIAIGLIAIQLLPFAEYLSISEGKRLREQHVSLPGTTALIGTIGGILLGIGFWVVLSLAGFSWYRSRRISSGVFAGALVGFAILIYLSLGGVPTPLLLLFPDLYGNPVDEVAYTGPHTYTDVNGGYVGCLGVLFAVSGALNGMFRKGGGVFFAVVGIVAGGIAFRVPLLYPLIRSLPVYSMIAETRVLSVVAMSSSILVGFGVSQFLKTATGSISWSEVSRPLLAWVGAVLVVFGGSLIPSTESDGGLAFLTPRPGDVVTAREPLPIEISAPHWADQVIVRVDGNIIARKRRTAEEPGPWIAEVALLSAARMDDGQYRIDAEALGQGREESLGSVPIHLTREKQWTWRLALWPSISLGILGLLLLFKVGRSKALPYLIPILMFSDLYAFGWDYNEVAKKERVFPETAITSFLKNKSESEGPFRVVPEGVILQPNIPYVYGFSHLRGYDCIEPWCWMAVLRHLNRDGEVPWQSWNRETIRYESTLFDLLGVRYVVSENDDLATVPGFVPVLKAEGVTIFENTEVWPRASLFSEAISVQDATLDLDPTKVATVDDPSKLMPLGGRGTAALSDYQDDEVLINVAIDGRSLLVLTDTYFPGWKVEVDGKERELISVHGAFRGVLVMSGDEKVRFFYEPLSFTFGAISSALTCLVAMMWVVRSRRRFTSSALTTNPS